MGPALHAAVRALPSRAAPRARAAHRAAARLRGGRRPARLQPERRAAARVARAAGADDGAQPGRGADGMSREPRAARRPRPSRRLPRGRGGRGRAPPRAPPGVRELRAARSCSRFRSRSPWPPSDLSPGDAFSPPPAVVSLALEPPTNGFMVRHIPDEPLPPSAKHECRGRARLPRVRQATTPHRRDGKAIAMAVRSMAPVAPRRGAERARSGRLIHDSLGLLSLEVGGRRAARARRRHPPLPRAARGPRADLGEGADPDAARDGARRPRRPPRARRGAAARRVRADAAGRQPRRRR